MHDRRDRSGGRFTTLSSNRPDAASGAATAKPGASNQTLRPLLGQLIPFLSRLEEPDPRLTLPLIFADDSIQPDQVRVGRTVCFLMSTGLDFDLKHLHPSGTFDRDKSGSIESCEPSSESVGAEMAAQVTFERDISHSAAPGVPSLLDPFPQHGSTLRLAMKIERVLDLSPGSFQNRCGATTDSERAHATTIRVLRQRRRSLVKRVVSGCRVAKCWV